MTTATATVRVASTIIEQLGGAARVALRVRDIVATERGVMFRVGTTRGRMVKAIIDLNAWDLYDIRVLDIHGRTFDVTTRYEATNVYADVLADVVAHGAREAGVQA